MKQTRHLMLFCDMNLDLESSNVRFLFRRKQLDNLTQRYFIYIFTANIK